MTKDFPLPPETVVSAELCTPGELLPLIWTDQVVFGERAFQHGLVPFAAGYNLHCEICGSLILLAVAFEFCEMQYVGRRFIYFQNPPQIYIWHCPDCEWPHLVMRASQLWLLDRHCMTLPTLI